LSAHHGVAGTIDERREPRHVEIAESCIAGPRQRPEALAQRSRLAARFTGANDVVAHRLPEQPEILSPRRAKYALPPQRAESSPKVAALHLAAVENVRLQPLEERRRPAVHRTRREEPLEDAIVAAVHLLLGHPLRN